MRSRPIRNTGLAVVLLSLFSTSSFSNQVCERSTDVPSFETIYLLEELSEWIDSEVPLGRIPQRIRERPMSFEAFVGFLDTADRRTALIAMPFAAAIVRAAHDARIDPLLVAAIVEAESSFNPRAVSYKGAVGLMQLMPSTVGADFAPELGDPELNLQLGSAYFGRLLSRFEGDVTLALAAYNAGPGSVSRHRGVPPYRETERYVQKVLSRYVELNQQVWMTTNAGRFLTSVEASPLSGIG